MRNPLIITALSNVRNFLLAAFLLTGLSFTADAQTAWVLNPITENYYPTPASLRADVEYLADTLLQGRGIGSGGHAGAQFYISKRFQKERLHPIGGYFVHHFRLSESGGVGHNVIGMIEGSRTKVCRKYIIVAAHYDHLGTINGKIYPGADANASGVAAMINIAHTFRCQRDAGFVYDTNLIFVAYDAYTEGGDGIRALYEKIACGALTDPCNGIRILPEQIVMAVDLDQVGSTLKPVEPRYKNYLIAIDGASVKDSHEILLRANKLYGTQLKLYFDYYGSARFTPVFHRLGGRKHLISHGIPTMFFTSGITKYNNTVNDTPGTLDYDILARRAILIFRFIEKKL